MRFAPAALLALSSVSLAACGTSTPAASSSCQTQTAAGSAALAGSATPATVEFRLVAASSSNSGATDSGPGCGTFADNLKGTKPTATECTAYLSASGPMRSLPDGREIAFDQKGRSYLLGTALFGRSGIANATATTTCSSPSWLVLLDLRSAASQSFEAATARIAGTNQQFAIVVNGVVVSAPTASERIGGGRAQISGNFTEAEAQALAANLNAGGTPPTN